MQDAKESPGRVPRKIQRIQGKEVTVFPCGHLVDQGRSQKRIQLVRKLPFSDVLLFFHMHQNEAVERRLWGVQRMQGHQKESRSQEADGHSLHGFSRSAG